MRERTHAGTHREKGMGWRRDRQPMTVVCMCEDVEVRTEMCEKRKCCMQDQVKRQEVEEEGADREWGRVQTRHCSTSL